MNSLASFRHEFCNRRIGARWLKKFDSALTEIQHCEPNALIVDLIIARDFQAKRFLVYLRSLRQRFDRNADVINLHLNL